MSVLELMLERAGWTETRVARAGPSQGQSAAHNKNNLKSTDVPTYEPSSPAVWGRLVSWDNDAVASSSYQNTDTM